ncbi:elongation factor P [Buchnera aphidicola (Hormaphis cornu)]|nr:elongation factor P [Buchnera aphidicola (Hormaphis cornu)]
MTIFYSNNLKKGLKIIFQKEPCEIESIDFIKPGKGQTFVRIKLRKLLTGKLIDKTFKSTDEFHLANVINIKVIYLYHDNEICCFMNSKNFDQLTINKKILDNCIQWFLKGHKYSAIQWNRQLISVFPNNFIELQVIQIQSKIKRDISSGSQYAKLNTGVVLKVPFFIKVRDWIKIDTRIGKYICRIKKIKK